MPPTHTDRSVGMRSGDVGAPTMWTTLTDRSTMEAIILNAQKCELHAVRHNAQLRIYLLTKDSSF